MDLIQLLLSMFNFTKPTLSKSGSSKVVRLIPKINPDTEEVFSYREITNAVTHNALVMAGSTPYQFKANPKDDKNGYDESFSLVHTISLDDSDVISALDIA